MRRSFALSESEKAIVMPIKKQPIQFTSRVPNASEVKIGLSHIPIPQRANTPPIAPRESRKSAVIFSSVLPD